MLLTAPTIVDEEALLVMKPHCDMPLSITGTAMHQPRIATNRRLIGQKHDPGPPSHLPQCTMLKFLMERWQRQVAER